ncbi:MAG: glutamate racemase [Gallionella sp.]
MNPENPSANPIGVFDSGVGGLAVLQEIRRELPGENLLYVADSAHAPYGDKTSRQIEARSIAIAGFLVSQNAKAIVVACNTASGAAVETLRARFPLPIVAMEPAVKPAAAHTKTGVIGVLATSRTITSDNFAKLHQRFGAGVRILMQACPGLVEQVEAGKLSGHETRALVERYVLPLLEQQADTIVLGCTHYPFLAPLIREIAGAAVTIMDPSPAIARELRRRLNGAALLSSETRPGSVRFWSSANSESNRRVISGLWKTEVELQLLPDNPGEASG